MLRAIKKESIVVKLLEIFERRSEKELLEIVVLSNNVTMTEEEIDTFVKYYGCYASWNREKQLKFINENLSKMSKIELIDFMLEFIKSSEIKPSC